MPPPPPPPPSQVELPLPPLVPAAVAETVQRFVALTAQEHQRMLHELYLAALVQDEPWPLPAGSISKWSGSSLLAAADGNAPPVRLRLQLAARHISPS